MIPRSGHASTAFSDRRSARSPPRSTTTSRRAPPSGNIAGNIVVTANQPGIHSQIATQDRNTPPGSDPGSQTSAVRDQMSTNVCSAIVTPMKLSSQPTAWLPRRRTISAPITGKQTENTRPMPAP